ncbi:hypothetical protein PVAP13_6NG166403, partial [Panicum virgatum]
RRTTGRRRVTSWSSTSDRHSRRSPTTATGVAARARGSGDSIVQGTTGMGGSKGMRKLWLPLGVDHRTSRLRKAPAVASDRAPSCRRMKAAGRQRPARRPAAPQRVPGSELRA